MRCDQLFCPWLAVTAQLSSLASAWCRSNALCATVLWIPRVQSRMALAATLLRSADSISISDLTSGSPLIQGLVRQHPEWPGTRPNPGGLGRPGKSPATAVFFYIKKKIQKYMSVLENFKNIPRSPNGGRQGSNVIFFLLQICNKVPGEKKRGGPVAPATGPCRPPQGRQASGPARGAGRPSCGRQGGPVAPSHGDRVSPPI